MKVMKVDVRVGRWASEATDVLVLFQCEGSELSEQEAASLDKALGGSISDLLRSKEFEGKTAELVLLHTHRKIPAKRLLLVGLGKKDALGLETIRQALGHAVKRVRQVKAASFTAAVPAVTPPDSTMIDVAQAMTEGAILGAYQFTAYRSEPTPGPDIRSMTLLTSQSSDVRPLSEGIRRGVATAEAAVFVRDLCNHPSNVMTPTKIAEEAKAVAKEAGVSLKILERKDMAKLGMGALLGVARGSHEPPKFIILEYHGARKKNDRPVVLVGKTITFDTGGISLKPAENMEHMKADMTGGAEVLAAVRAAARLKLPLNLVGLLPATENMPGGGAMKPGDVVKTLSGKTVEVQNTDAEGRLILADGLAYAARYKPAAMIDVATLTGACVIALGQFAIGMFGTDDTLKESLRKAGQRSGERVWEMPLWEDYFEQLKSDVADMRNIGGRGAGMITAALFLSKFAGDWPWVHLDIASTDWSERERAYVPKGPTGIGTRLLIQYLMDRSL
ncbi:leucyl aminopeptidase [Candidatus Nitrospira inopinata]|jgi:leucyl aminopeptidase|uniref:Probable cytosol aminopeptidase n=1 Tax=Candidatus Nitrospira inopinata TaxID=1715989 RepID=A0A0S4KS88_9BACT|nr:leucyl aminopeptidase [Candidatus Nitrospira inopinata]CUQ66072.1 putative cytosol aminopeptidase [Candidatus Nitrospira inopinata]